MIPSASDIFALARDHLGDTSKPGGQIFQDNFLLQFWPDAYSTLYRYLDKNANRLLRSNKYFNLPAFTSYVTPAGLGISNMGKPLEVRDRAVANTWTGTIATINVAGVGVPPSIDVTTSSPHGLASGAQVVAFGFTGVTDDINDSWYVSVLDATNIRLLGCGALDLGSGVGSTGIISTGSGEFPSDPLNQLFDINALPLAAANGQLSQYLWQGGAFRFIPANVVRQIKVTFMLSGNPPVDIGSPIGIDDSLSALSLFLAASAASGKGPFKGKMETLFMRAVGNNSGDETNVRGGAFYSLAQIGLQALQETRVVMLRYRRKRNVGGASFSW